MWNCPNIWWKRRYRQSIFRVIFDCGRTWYQSSRVQLVQDLLIPNKIFLLHVCISFFMFSSKISLGKTSWYMIPMITIFLFGDPSDSFSNIWNFDWNPCLLQKWANLTKDFTISAPPPFIHCLWWYIYTFKIVDNKYLLIEFFRKEWEYPAKISVNIYHVLWYG